MEEQQRTRKDTKFAIIAIIAGLLTGGVLTYVFLQPEPAPPSSTTEYRVPESQHFPMGSAEAAEVPEPSAEASDDEAASPAPADTPDRPAPAAADEEDDEPTGADRAAIHGAERQLEAEGVTDYAELTEDLYIRISAKLVLAANALSEALGPDADPEEAQRLLADRAGELMAEARIDPDDYWEYTNKVHSDPKLAAEMGEKILREAEKHTERRITIKEVPGVSPTPVPGAPTQ